MAENKNDVRDTYTIYDDQSIGKVQIADEVVAIIAGLAATEVEGVASMAGNITNELVGKLGMKNLSKGVKVDVPGECGVCKPESESGVRLQHPGDLQKGAGQSEDSHREHDRTSGVGCEYQHCQRGDGTDKVKEHAGRSAEDRKRESLAGLPFFPADCRRGPAGKKALGCRRKALTGYPAVFTAIQA